MHADEGWLFLAVLIDMYSRQVVGWRCVARDLFANLPPSPETPQKKAPFRAALPDTPP